VVVLLTNESVDEGGNRVTLVNVGVRPIDPRQEHRLTADRSLDVVVEIPLEPEGIGQRILECADGIR
jgi:hypothetical protein